MGQGELPPSVRSIVLAKLDRLDQDKRRAARAAAVLGQQFWTATLRHLIDDEEFDPACLIASGLIIADSKDFQFAHAMVQETIEQSLLPGMRSSLHLKAALWFAGRDCIMHAEHLA